MNTKLTLTIEEEVIKTIKKYASDKGVSISQLVENYFLLLTNEEINYQKKKSSPKISKLRGILKVEEDFDYKKVLEEEISKKYEA